MFINVFVNYSTWWRPYLEITNFQGKGSLMKTPTEPESSSAGGSDPDSPANDSVSPKPQRPLTLQVFNYASGGSAC